MHSAKLSMKKGFITSGPGFMKTRLNFFYEYNGLFNSSAAYRDEMSGLLLLLLLTLNAPIATKVVCFSRLLKCLRNLYA